jgi:hypothetical protein
MRTVHSVLAGLSAVSLLAAATLAQNPSQPAAPMTFFVTSVGKGDGANLGGLAGADAHCQGLASAVGHGGRTWHAYLSAPAADGKPVVHARDRIGRGPWLNAAGVQVASSVEDLHSENNRLGRENSLSEKGTTIAPGRHDILTGSNSDGTLATGFPDTTCHGWTSHGDGRAMLGHHNRSGGGQRPTSWNSAHMSAGCSQSDLRATLGDALLYCFAID